MPVGDPGDGEKMAIVQQHEKGVQDLMNTEKECLKDEYSNATAEAGDSKFQEMTTDEEPEKLKKALDMKCKVETSTNEPVTQSNGESYECEKGKEDELEPNSGNGCDLSKSPWNTALSLTENSGKVKSRMPFGDPGEGDFDDILMTMAQQHQGSVQDLLDTIFSFLARRTDFYTVVSSSVVKQVVMEKLSKYELEALETEKKKEETDEDDEDLQPKSGSGCNLMYRCWTQTLSETQAKETKEEDISALSFNAMMDESLEMEKPKNPLLLNPVIRCVLKFLSIKDIKNARFVCHEWGLNGTLALASRAVVHFQKYEIYKYPFRRTVDFHNCFLNSATLFSAFKISGYLANVHEGEPWTIEELTNFFDKQQKYIKELTLQFKRPDEEIVKQIDLSSWISKSPLVQKDAKYRTKLSIEGDSYHSYTFRRLDRVLNAPPLQLIAHIQDLSLSRCIINYEAGIKIRPVKLELELTAVFQDGMKLDQVRINDILDFSKIKEVSLDCMDLENATKYVVDLRRKETLDKLILKNCEIVNGETSLWVIKHLATIQIPYSLNSQMKIHELFLYNAGTIDLFTLPTSIQNLVFARIPKIRCSQPIVLQNLQYLQIVESHPDLSFLSHFLHCPQLTHLKFRDCTAEVKLKSAWIPKSVKTFTLQRCHCKIKLTDKSRWNLETLVVDNLTIAQELCETKIRVEDLVVNYPYCSALDLNVDKVLVDFLERQTRYCLAKRLIIGEVKWLELQLENSLLKEYADVKSSFYVFQDGQQKGRALSRSAFHEFIPKHIDPNQYE